MNAPSMVRGLFLLAMLASGLSAQEFSVRKQDEDWTDSARNRTIPVRIFNPVQLSLPNTRDLKPAGGFPLVVFSPGLGGSRSVYGYFANHLASHGYVVVVLTHPGSDDKDFGARILRRAREGLTGGGADSRRGNALLDTIDDPEILRNRPKDVSFAIDRVLADGRLASMVNPEQIGVAGHSFGAHTAMCIGGMTVNLPEGKTTSFRDERVKAVLPMSPEGPGAMGIIAGAWDRFAVPVVFLTGTLDYGIGSRSAAWRQSGFENCRAVDRWLVTINRAGHMTFATPSLLGPATAGASHEELIEAVALGFFDAFLKNDAAARKWLGAFVEQKHGDCTVEFRKGEYPLLVTKATRANPKALAALETKGKVIHEDDFESPKALAAYFEVRGIDDGRARIDDDPKAAHAGRGSLRLVSPAAAGKSSGAGATFWFGPEGYDRVHLRYYIRFAPDYDQGNLNHTGGSLAGVAGLDKWAGMGGAGLRPKGDDDFSTRFEAWRDWGRVAPPGFLFLYTYWMDMKRDRDGHYWGNMMEPEEAARFVPERDRWTCCELMVKVNTVGQADGELAAWVDGRLYVHYTGFRWRSSEAVRLKRFDLGVYVHQATRENVVWFDDVVVSTGYVGPRP